MSNPPIRGVSVREVPVREVPVRGLPEEERLRLREFRRNLKPGDLVGFRGSAAGYVGMVLEQESGFGMLRPNKAWKLLITSLSYAEGNGTVSDGPPPVIGARWDWELFPFGEQRREEVLEKDWLEDLLYGQDMSRWTPK